MKEMRMSVLWLRIEKKEKTTPQPDKTSPLIVMLKGHEFWINMRCLKQSIISLRNVIHWNGNENIKSY